MKVSRWWSRSSCTSLRQQGFLTALFVGPLVIATLIILAIMALFSAFLLLARG